MNVNTQIDFRNEFCSNCGVKLSDNNIKGRCFECNSVVCNSCGSFDRGRLICVDCKRRIDDQLNSIRRRRDIGSLQ